MRRLDPSIYGLSAAFLAALAIDAFCAAGLWNFDGSFGVGAPPPPISTIIAVMAALDGCIVAAVWVSWRFLAARRLSFNLILGATFAARGCLFAAFELMAMKALGPDPNRPDSFLSRAALDVAIALLAGAAAIVALTLADIGRRRERRAGVASVFD